MSLVGKLALFAAKEIARPLLGSVGQAIGDRIGRYIDPEGAKIRAAMMAEQMGVEPENDEEEVEYIQSGQGSTSNAKTKEITGR